MICPNCKNEMKKINNDFICDYCGLFIDKTPKILCNDGFYTPTKGSYQMHSVVPKQYGWECPKCGAVMSPDQKTCPFCAPHINVKGGDFIC